MAGQKISKSELIKRTKKNIYGYSDPIDINLPKKINIIDSHRFNAWGFHRSGWKYVLHGLSHLHTPSGILLDDFVEQTHAIYYADNAKSGKIPYREPWVGFFHQPPKAPQWNTYYSTPQVVFNRDITKQSLESCLGIFVFTEYLKDWFDENLDVPCNVVSHPTETPDIKFSYDKFLDNEYKTVVQLGHHLRKLLSIQKLKTDMMKVWPVPCEWSRTLYAIESNREDLVEIEMNNGNYTELPWISNEDYDEMLSKNIVFLDLYDSSVNNAVVECIVRNTPILVNKIPPIVELLGPNYPFYFNDLEDASKKLKSFSLVKETHEYISCLDKSPYDMKNFLVELCDTEIYKSL